MHAAPVGSKPADVHAPAEQVLAPHAMQLKPSEPHTAFAVPDWQVP